MRNLENIIIQIEKFNIDRLNPDKILELATIYNSIIKTYSSENLSENFILELLNSFFTANPFFLKEPSHFEKMMEKYKELYRKNDNREKLNSKKLRTVSS